MKPDLLLPALLTSCSDLPLAPLIDDVCKTTGVGCFELYLLRNADIRACVQAPSASRPPWSLQGERSTLKLFEEPANLPFLREWFLQQLQAIERPFRLSAFATFLPELSARDDVARGRAVAALANIVGFCIDLKRAIKGVELIAADDPVIVEFVCGSIVSRDSLQGTKGVFRFESRIEVINRLVDSIAQTVEIVARKYPQDIWALGAELEPGVSFAANSAKALDYFFEQIDQSCANGQDGFLASRVGLNLDIAHFILADVPLDSLKKHARRIVNAHISDHPRTHVKDQVPGRWHSVFRHPRRFQAFLDVYREAARERQEGKLPLSGCVSLELEGCGNHEWINHGLGSLRHLLSA